MTEDLSYFEEHYDIRHPFLTDHMWEVVDHLHAHCPVVHSDATMMGSSVKGFWVLTRYQDVFGALQDWKTFSSDRDLMARYGHAHGVSGTNMPPITTDPPLHREFRRLLNPFLTPQSVAAYEQQSRRIVTALIDAFIEDGHCDLVAQLTRLFPPQIFFQAVFGIEDDDERASTQKWTHKIVFEDNPPDYMEAAVALWNWINEFLKSRRSEPRRDDIVDAILHGTVEGRAITDEEAAGIIQILIIGGFGTTSDAISATMLKLVEHPEVQERLRREPTLIPAVFDEVLRMEPPVIGMQRVATRDVEIDGRNIREGEQVLLHFGAANRDPAEFEHPAEFDAARRGNRHLSFGGGVHRCMGSNLARLNLRVVFEELLTRLDDIRLTDGEALIHRSAQLPWGLDYLPLTFIPRGR